VTYDYNLLVSCPWTVTAKSMHEICSFLTRFGDNEPLVEPTIARGIMGVRTHLDSRAVIKELKTFFDEEPTKFQYTLKWIPVDLKKPDKILCIDIVGKYAGLSVLTPWEIFPATK
jgi:tRNA(Ser,Leu) C12 N-acetylase TAN1